MSKIVRESSEHLTFGELESLTDLIANDTVCLQQDILQKCAILNERQSSIIAHENMLFKIDEAVKIVKSAIGTVERELELMECDFQVMEELVEKLQLAHDTNSSDFTPKPKTERENFMRALYETDSSILNIKTVFSEMERARLQGCDKQSDPIIALFNILNCHQQTLSSAEKKMDLILDKLLEISTKSPQ